MSEGNDQPSLTPKKRSGLKTDPMFLFRRACQMLKEPMDAPNSKPWGDGILAGLFTIAAQGESSLSLQAVRIVSEMVAKFADHAAGVRQRRCEARSDNPAPSTMSEEELDAEIAELEAQLASINPSAPSEQA